MWEELDIDEDRNEPIFKVTVLVLTAGVMIAGLRAHCCSKYRPPDAASASGTVFCAVASTPPCETSRLVGAVASSGALLASSAHTVACVCQRRAPQSWLVASAAVSCAGVHSRGIARTLTWLPSPVPVPPSSS